VLLKKQMLDEARRAAAGGKRRANGAVVRPQDCLSGDGWYQQQARQLSLFFNYWSWANNLCCLGDVCSVIMSPCSNACMAAPPRLLGA
jgi:hypothetical protein